MYFKKHTQLSIDVGERDQYPIQQSLSAVNKKHLIRDEMLETVQVCYFRKFVLQ